MVTRYFIFETLTGDILKEIEPLSSSWSARLNEPETVDVSMSLLDGTRDWRNYLTPWKHSLLVDESGRLMGGPIQPHDYEPGSPVKVTARGIRAYFKKRNILPPSAISVPLVLSDGSPNETLDTKLSGLDLGSIGRFLVWQACQWDGAQLPIVFEEPRTGTRVREYKAVELKDVDSALTQLSEVLGGPDFDFRLRWVDDSHVEWVFVSGTEDDSGLSSTAPTDPHIVWDLSASESVGRGPSIQVNPSDMGSLSWSSAGRGDDSVLIARQYDPLLVDRGMPLMEIVDTSHTNVVVQDTLDGYAKEALRTGRQPSEFWKFSVSLGAAPYLRDYRVGDYCMVQISGDPYIPDGEYVRRIMELSGDQDGLWCDVTCGEAFGVI